MSRIRRNLKLVLLAGMAAGIAFVVVKLRHTQKLATHTVGDIEAQIDALDPVTRAAVVAKLTADAAKDVKTRTADAVKGRQGKKSMSRFWQGSGRPLAPPRPAEPAVAR